MNAGSGYSKFVFMLRDVNGIRRYVECPHTWAFGIYGRFRLHALLRDYGKWAWCFSGMLGCPMLQLKASKMHIPKSITPRICARNAYQYETLSVLITRTKTSHNLDVLWFSSLSTSCLITSLCNEVSSRFHPTALPIIIRVQRATSLITKHKRWTINAV